jgi:hypothetical protein
LSLLHFAGARQPQFRLQPLPSGTRPWRAVHLSRQQHERREKAQWE